MDIDLRNYGSCLDAHRYLEAVNAYGAAEYLSGSLDRGSIQGTGNCPTDLRFCLLHCDGFDQCLGMDRFRSMHSEDTVKDFKLSHYQETQ